MNFLTSITIITLTLSFTTTAWPHSRGGGGGGGSGRSRGRRRRYRWGYDSESEEQIDGGDEGQFSSSRGRRFRGGGGRNGWSHGRSGGWSGSSGFYVIDLTSGRGGGGNGFRGRGFGGGMPTEEEMEIIRQRLIKKFGGGRSRGRSGRGGSGTGNSICGKSKRRQRNGKCKGRRQKWRNSCGTNRKFPQSLCEDIQQPQRKKFVLEVLKGSTAEARDLLNLYNIQNITPEQAACKLRKRRLPKECRSTNKRGGRGTTPTTMRRTTTSTTFPTATTSTMAPARFRIDCNLAETALPEDLRTLADVDPSALAAIIEGNPNLQAIIRPDCPNVQRLINQLKTRARMFF